MIVRDPEVISRYLEDAAHYPGGHADGVARPANAEQVAVLVTSADCVLVVGAQSSLTGGATPHGGLVISTERLVGIELLGDRVKAGAGVRLDALQHRLADHGLWFPPVPTFLGATVGGAVSTNAAGASTFKYGPVRPWVDGLTVVLASGEVLSLTRGDLAAASRVPVPTYRMPDVPKCSAGYFAAPQMDLIDVFIGAEGTLGVIVDATLRVRRRPAATCWAFIPVRDEEHAIALVADLRQAAQLAWASNDPIGIDIAAIEHIDARSLAVVREDGVHQKLNITIPDHMTVVLLVQIELHDAASEDALWGRVAKLVEPHDVLDHIEVVLPGNDKRAAALMELREAVPAGVNRRVAQARAKIDGRIHKTAADMIVPFASFGDMMRRARALFADRGLDLAVWGHISDGNVHPNVIPRSFEDVERGREAILELGRIVIEMGGSPLAEHGVGRNPTKQQLLRMLYGREGIDEMRAVKQSLDPDRKLSPGVLFEE